MPYCNDCDEYCEDTPSFWDRGERCRSCARRDPADQETFDSSADIDVSALGFNPLEFSTMRGVMTTSVELEFGDDPDSIAWVLHERGLSPVSSVDTYHGAARSGHGGAAYVEYDGSVSGGGEMVISFLDLPEQRAVNRLWGSLAVLRQHIRSGDNKLDTRCGCHIHVSAVGRPLGEIVTSTGVYGYLEDILYRIASANYKKHRVLAGNSYTGLTPKHFNKSTFRRTMNERYLGMNVSNYLGYRSDCSCGVGFDAADLCTCDTSNFYKPTIEFRLFNSTANPIKLHAYIALSQAIIHYGVGRDMSPGDFGDPLDYMNGDIPSSVDPRQYASRIVWMFQNLPLSKEERNSIRYCLRNCDIGGYLEQAAVDGRIETDLVQGILHDDTLIEVEDYQTPERVPTTIPEPPRSAPRFHSYTLEYLGERVVEDVPDGCEPYVRVGYRHYFVGPRGGIRDYDGNYYGDPRFTPRNHSNEWHISYFRTICEERMTTIRRNRAEQRQQRTWTPTPSNFPALDALLESVESRPF